jgi:hypothetical protein
MVMLSVATRTPSALAQADNANPKAALKSLYAAVERGDAAAIQQLLVIDNDPQQQLLKLYVDLIVSGKRLADVTRQKFPGAANPMAQGTITPEDAIKIDKATEKIDGDTATLQISGQPTAVTLRKSNGSWKVVYGEGAYSGPDHQAQRRQILESFIQAMKTSADEIAADKYATVQDAEAALKERLSAVVSRAMQINPPTSRPITRERQAN